VLIGTPFIDLALWITTYCMTINIFIMPLCEWIARIESQNHAESQHCDRKTSS